MTTFSRLLFVAICATGFTSCDYPAYDASYSSSIGYTGGGSALIHTTSDRWFYNSTVRCYYDRTRQCYYDPWLNGYYPRGYCPRPVAYVPHPYGWNGHGACPPPRGVHHRSIDRYHDRVALLRARNYAWASRVRERNQANAQHWRELRARQATQFAANQNLGGRRPAITASTPRPHPSADRRPSNQCRPSEGANTAFRNPFFNNPGRQPGPQASTPSRQPSRPQASVPSRQPSRPQVNRPSRPPNSPQTTEPPRPPNHSSDPPAPRPGCRQPVKNTPPPARPSRNLSAQLRNAAHWSNLRSTPRRNSR